MKKDIEKALMEFLMDVRTTGQERKKGIPLVTFVYKEEDRAVLLKALPLPLADIQPEEKQLAGKELLYRVDFFREGEAKVSFGILPVVKKSAPFLTLLEDAVKRRPESRVSVACDYLKFHSALCGLEALAEGGTADYGADTRENAGHSRGRVKDRSTGQIYPCQHSVLQGSPLLCADRQGYPECLPLWNAPAAIP